MACLRTRAISVLPICLSVCPGPALTPRLVPSSLTRRGGGACAPVLAVVPALVDLALLPVVAWLAAALGLLAGVEEAAAAIQADQVAGVCGGHWEGGMEVSRTTLGRTPLLLLQTTYRQGTRWARE